MVTDPAASPAYLGDSDPSESARIAPLADEFRPRAKFTRREIANAWGDSSWFFHLGGFGSGYWRGQPWWYRGVSQAGWYLRNLTERPTAAWQIITAEPHHRDCGQGLRMWLIVARGVLCAFTGRIIHAYPMRHDLSYELTSWDHATWAGAEYTCWRAKFAAVCTGRAWHLHVYEDGE